MMLIVRNAPLYDVETEEEEREVFCDCDICGEPILASDDRYEGDEYVEIDGYLMHDECVWEWVKKNRRQA